MRAPTPSRQPPDPRGGWRRLVAAAQQPWAGLAVWAAGLAGAVGGWFLLALASQGLSASSDPGMGMAIVGFLVLVWEAGTLALVGALSLPPIRRRTPHLPAAVAACLAPWPALALIAAAISVSV